MATTQYFIAVEYSEFITWYRLGAKRILRQRLVEARFEDSRSSLLATETQKALLDSIPEYEDDWQIIICQVGLDGKVGEGQAEECPPYLLLSLRAVKALYPITERGRSLLQNRLDPTLELQEPLLEDGFLMLDERRHREVSFRGGNAVLQYFGLDDQIGSLTRLNDEAAQGLTHRSRSVRLDELNAGVVQGLFCYDRHDPTYPRTSLGFGFDLGKIIFELFGREESVRSSLRMLRSLLDQCRASDATLWDVIEELKPYLYDLETATGSPVTMEGALIFLQLQEIWRADNRGSALSDVEPLIKNIQGTVARASLAEGLWLAGVWFGFASFATEYYGKVRLPFMIERAHIDEVQPDGEQNGKGGELDEMEVLSQPQGGPEAPQESLVVPYERVSLATQTAEHGELKNEPVERLAVLIKRVVEVESPVHRDIVFSEIRTAYNVKKRGRRIDARLEEALASAMSDGEMTEKDGFLYADGEMACSVRDRSTERDRADLKLVAPEEIERAAELALLDDARTKGQLLERITAMLGLAGKRNVRKELEKRLRALQKFEDVLDCERNEDLFAQNSDSLPAR